MIQPRIVTLAEKKLVGIKTEMSLVNNKTGQLWASFMPRLGEVKHLLGSDKISLQRYGVDHFKAFNPHNTFEKWAVVEVKQIEDVPEGMLSLILPAGLYAIFDYKGSSADPSIFQYIYSQWLPTSGYQLDDRPHFEILGDKYRNNDPNSEEQICIPILEG